MFPIMNKNKDAPKDVVTTTSNVITSNIGKENISDNVNRSRDFEDNDNDFESDLNDITIGQLDKFVRVTDKLEKSIERRNERHAPIESFGEKLGMKIEQRMTDTMIDKMMQGMFNVGGATTKPSGYLEIVKTILDSGFAQQAGAKLPETIDALTRNIGKQRMEQLADATVQAIGPAKKTGEGKGSVSVEEEQKKMEKFVLELNHVNIIDLKKFMELVNANPANGKITDINQAREILKQEQERIRRENPALVNELAILNQDKDTGVRQLPNQYGNAYGSSIDRMPDDMMNNMMPRDPSSMQTNQMSTEQILSLDPDNDMSVNAYAWSMGYGNMLSEQNGLTKVKNILRRQQEDLMKQLQGLGGSVGEPIGETVIEQDQSLDQEQEQPLSGDMKWGEEDIGKKGVGKGKRIGDEGIVIPPGVAKADGPIDNGNNKENVVGTETQITQNNILELLQKMAQNFDMNMGEINQKLQAVENRVAKVESVNNISDVIVKEENVNNINPEDVRVVMDLEFPEDINVELEKDTIQEEQINSEMLDVSDTEIVSESVTEEESSGVKIKAPRSVLDEQQDSEWKPPTNDEIKLAEKLALERNMNLSSLNKNIKTDLKETKSFPKGSIGWLKEQKKKSENKNSENKNNI